MRAPTIAVTAAALLIAGCGHTLANSVVLDTDSSQVGEPGSFVVTGRWDLKYSWDCSRQHSERLTGLDTFDMRIDNTEDMSGAADHPALDRTGAKGTGVLHFQHAGEYSVVLNTACDWRVQAIDRST